MDKISSVKIGNKIKLLRQDSWMSQIELAWLIWVKKVYIWRIENWIQKVKVHDVLKLANVFWVSTDSLLIDSVDLVNTPHKPAEESVVSKLKPLIHYIVDQYWSRPNFWKTVLYKILYYCESDRYTKNQEILTWLNFYKFPRWPIPEQSTFDKAVTELKDEWKVDIEEITYYNRSQFRLKSKLDSNISTDFTEEQKNLINQTIVAFINFNAKDISNYSHKDPARLVSDHNEQIWPKLWNMREYWWHTYKERESMYKANSIFFS